jgi:cobalt/nickel transport system permease protein
VTGTVLSLFASSNPDGLEWSVAGVSGGEELRAEGPVFSFFAAIQERLSFMPDYDTKTGEGTGTSAAGLIGAALTVALAGAAVLIIRASKKKRKNAVK